MPARAFPANRDRVMGRAACDRRTIHVHDLAAEDSEYPVGSKDAKREGHHTTLATPLLREGTPIGVILIRAMGGPPVQRQPDRPSRDLRRPGGPRDRKRAPVRSRKAAHAGAYARHPRSRRTRRKIGRLVDANIIGIFISGCRQVGFIEANESFLRLGTIQS